MGLDIASPGVIARRPFPSPNGGRFLYNEAGYYRFDSLAVDAEGNVCVATLISGRSLSSLPTAGWFGA